jgi:hypothetical protein
MDPRYFSKTEVSVTRVEVMELTPEEIEMIKEQRAKKARTEEIEKQFEILVNAFRKIEELNGRIKLPYNGCYCPILKLDELSLSY